LAARRLAGRAGKNPAGFIVSGASTPLHATRHIKSRRLGFVEGQNLAVDWNGYGLSAEQFEHHAAELVNARVDFIVAGGDAAVRAPQRATTTIPIFSLTADLVQKLFVDYD
jgi:putative ABC transport system substrate-binding protein